MGQCGGHGKNFILATCRKGFYLNYFQFARGERACFIHGDVLDLGQFFNGDTSSEKNTTPSSRCNASKDS